MSHTVLFEVYRKEGMAHEDFKRYWLEVHAPIAAKIPGILSYTIYIAEDEPGRAPNTPDGFVIQTYPTMEAFEAGMSSDGMAVAGADAANFTQRFSPFSVSKYAVVGSE